MKITKTHFHLPVNKTKTPLSEDLKVAKTIFVEYSLKRSRLEIHSEQRGKTTLKIMRSAVHTAKSRKKLNAKGRINCKIRTLSIQHGIQAALTSQF